MDEARCFLALPRPPERIAPARRPRRADRPRPLAVCSAPAARFPARRPRPICAPAASPAARLARLALPPVRLLPRKPRTLRSSSGRPCSPRSPISTARSPASCAPGSIRAVRRKRRFADPRRALGHLLGNGVRFGDSRATILAAGEGVETMLALKSVLPPAADDRRALGQPPRRPRSAAGAAPSLCRARQRRGRSLRGEPAARTRRGAGIDVRDLVPVHGDFNLDLCRLGPAAHARASGGRSSSRPTGRVSCRRRSIEPRCVAMLAVARCRAGRRSGCRSCRRRACWPGREPRGRPSRAAICRRRRAAKRRRPEPGCNGAGQLFSAAGPKGPALHRETK